MSEQHGETHNVETPVDRNAASLPNARGSRAELLVGLTLLAVVFAFHLALEMRLRTMGAFTYLNTLFNADPGLTIEAITSGGGSNHISHPLLEYFFSIPIRIVAKLGSLVTGGGLDEAAARYAVGMLVVPVAAGLQTFALLRLLRQLGLGLRSAVLLTLLGSVAFSKLVLGSMPESYCLSALCICLAYLLFLHTRESRGFRVELKWMALGVFTAGITLTNIVAVAILYLVREWRTGRGVRRGLVRTAGMTAVVLVVALVGGWALDEAFDAEQGGTPDEMVWIQRYLVDDPGVQLTTFPTAVVNGIAPPTPLRKPNNFALRAERAAAKKNLEKRIGRPTQRTALRKPGAPSSADEGTAPDAAADAVPDATQDAAPGATPPAASELGTPDDSRAPPGFANRRQAESDSTADSAVEPPPATLDETGGGTGSGRTILFSLTLQRTHSPRSVRNVIGLALLAVLAWVALKDDRLHPTFRTLARASLAVLAFNWVFHGFWGGEQFLYSQHWHISLLVLFGAAVSVIEERKWNSTVPLAIAVVGVAASNWMVLSSMLRALLGE